VERTDRKLIEKAYSVRRTISSRKLCSAPWECVQAEVLENEASWSSRGEAPNIPALIL